MGEIACVPLDGFSRYTIENLTDNLEHIFQCPVSIQDGFDTRQYAFDPSRGQFNSTAILLRLQTSLKPPADRVLGLTSADLFIPIFTFVFGEAQLNGPAAVVSGFRLRNEFYGLNPHPELLRQRLLKECVHELGHTFGLRHCRSIGCVMEKSTYVENIDLKSVNFCPACHHYLQENGTLKS